MYCALFRVVSSETRFQYWCLHCGSISAEAADASDRLHGLDAVRADAVSPLGGGLH